MLDDLDYLEKAFQEARFGQAATLPFSDTAIPTVFDKTLAPEGVHVMSMFTQWVPAEWADEDGHEEDLEQYADRLIDRMNAVAPNFKGSIMHRQIIGPRQMQQDWGLIGGNIFHGELTVDQLFHMRPAPGYADYRTPIRGLYQASSATHAGGGVTGHAGPPLRARDPEGQGRPQAQAVAPDASPRSGRTAVGGDGHVMRPDTVAAVRDGGAGFGGSRSSRSITTRSGCTCFGPNADAEGRPM